MTSDLLGEILQIYPAHVKKALAIALLLGEILSRECVRAIAFRRTHRTRPLACYILRTHSMWHLFHLIARPFEIFLGVFCLVTAGLLYPKEDGTIQSKLEDFWVKVDDYQGVALSRHTVFVTYLARLETRFLDKVFGRKPISFQSVVVSACCTFGLLLVGFFYWILADNHMLGWTLLLVVITAFVLVCSAAIPERYSVVQHILVNILFWCLWILLILLLLFTLFFFVSGLGGKWNFALFTIIVALGAFACDVVFIIVTRRVLRWAGEMVSSLKVVAIVLANLALALCLAGLPLLSSSSLHHIPLFGQIDDTFSLAAWSITITNIFDVLLALLFVLLGVVLLLHRLLWPLLTRTLFRMQDIGTKGRRAILSTIGFALLGTSIFGGEFPKLWEKILEKFGG